MSAKWKVGTWSNVIKNLSSKRISLFCRNIDELDKTMDEINEQTENMKQIQEALSTPIGATADFDEVITSTSLWILFDVLLLLLLTC